MSEITQALSFFEPKPLDYEKLEFMEILNQDSASKILNLILNNIASFKNLDAKETKALIDSIGINNGFKKGKELYMPIRIALTARLHGPDLSRIFTILKTQQVQTRIKNALALNLQTKS